MKALLLLAFGGPRSLDEVESLLTRLFRGRKPSPDQLERVKERYRLIGGRSPLPEITRNQAEGLEKELRAKGHPFKGYVGMRYGHPLIEETLNQIRSDGLKDVIAIPMAPFQSRASTGAYMDEANRVNKKLGRELAVSFVGPWHGHSLFIESVCERIEEGLNAFSTDERKRVHLIFTAHSLPRSMVADDPYLEQIEESARAVIGKLGHRLPWRIAFQSKGAGPEEWIGPDVESVLEGLAKESVREVLVIPIGFVCDHIEILYDIDIDYQKKADSLGLFLKRSPSLNTSETFIHALTEVIEEHLSGKKD